MKSFFYNKIALLGFLLILGTNLSFSQNPQAYFYDSEFDLSFPVATDWSMGIGLGYRSMLQERLSGEKISGAGNEHLELNHFTGYKSSESVVLSLGLRYRFKELFDSSDTNEFRIIEQVEIEPVNSSLPLAHRFRLEQRFIENLIHRVRYELGYSRSISEVFSLEASTEALCAVSAQLKPEAEQRFTLGIGNSSFKDLELGISFEYRMENYALDLAHEFFLITGVSLSL